MPGRCRRAQRRRGRAVPARERGIALVCLTGLSRRPGKMYSFGNEEADSLERLFGFFCECVRRGHWELAQACVPQLSRWHGDGPAKVEAILQALVACPMAVR